LLTQDSCGMSVAVSAHMSGVCKPDNCQVPAQLSGAGSIQTSR
jgi:hypothetical protein